MLEADYYWMYDDGYSGSSTTNSACSLSDQSGLLGPPRHHPAPVRQLPQRPAGPLHGRRVLGVGLRRRFHRRRSSSVRARRRATSPRTGASWPSAVQSSSRTVAITPTPNGTGYWEVEANGTVAAFGSAPNYGSLSGSLNAPIVGMASTPDGRGYWLVGSDGGIFSFGDAAFFGSTGSLRLNRPIVGIASTPNGRGYWTGGLRRRHLQLRRRVRSSAPWVASRSTSRSSAWRTTRPPAATGRWPPTAASSATTHRSSAARAASG